MAATARQLVMVNTGWRQYRRLAHLRHDRAPRSADDGRLSAAHQRTAISISGHESCTCRRPTSPCCCWSDDCAAARAGRSSQAPWRARWRSRSWQRLCLRRAVEPHDRYGARMSWLAVLVILLAFWRVDSRVARKPHPVNSGAEPHLKIEAGALQRKFSTDFIGGWSGSLGHGPGFRHWAPALCARDLAPSAASPPPR